MKYWIIVGFSLLFVACGDTGSISSVCTPTAGGIELCDGIDNDCNGQIDETFNVGATCEGAEGACTTGKIVCAPDKVSTMCGAAEASEEICDGFDNDCDGQVDEGFNVGEACSAGEGACANTGSIQCNPDGTAACNAVAGEVGANEICDGMDNNCNGEVDEGFETIGETCTIGEGACRSEGVVVCDSNKSTVLCDAITNAPAAEICDGIDNNCNGQTDEGFNVGTACTAGVGVCEQAGTIVCLEDGTAGCSAVAGTPPQTTETICDNLDNDCDGMVDEGCDEDGDNYCSSSFTVVGNPAVCPKGGGDCNDGSAAVNPGATEVCDGIDNSCSGRVDYQAIDATSYYLDCDADGFAFDEVAKVVSCTEPLKATAGTECNLSYSKWTTRAPVGTNKDCHPNNSYVFPGQTAFFANAMLSPPSGVSSFDYNCDRIQERAFTKGGATNLTLADCPSMPYSTIKSSCSLPIVGLDVVFIYAGAAPQCGQTALGKICSNYERNGTTTVCKAHTVLGTPTQSPQYCR